MISPFAFFILYLMAFAALLSGTLVGGWMLHAPWPQRVAGVLVLALLLRLSADLPAPTPFLGFNNGWVDWMVLGILNGCIRFRVARV